MRQKPGRTWSYIVFAAIGLAAIPLAGRIAKKPRRHEVDPDSAPGYTARRSFGAFSVLGRCVTIAKPRAELFRHWRDFCNLPGFIENLDKVEQDPADPSRNTWFIRAPAGKVYTVKTTIAREIENELIAWRSSPDSDIETEGRVSFHDAPGTRGTRVGLIIAYKSPGGAIGQAIARLMRRTPELQARHDLKRFKMLMETGEIATSARTTAEHREKETA